MKFAVIAASALASILCGGAVHAQSASGKPSPPRAIIVLPETVRVLPTEHIGGMDPGPQSPEAARKEAAAALAQARAECRRDGTAAGRRTCLADAREDHDRAMARLRR